MGDGTGGEGEGSQAEGAGWMSTEQKPTLTPALDEVEELMQEHGAPATCSTLPPWSWTSSGRSTRPHSPPSCRSGLSSLLWT
jgi:hypothetical protein